MCVCRCWGLPAIILSTDEIALLRIWDIEPRLASLIRRGTAQEAAAHAKNAICSKCIQASLAALRLARQPLAIAGYT